MGTYHHIRRYNISIIASLLIGYSCYASTGKYPIKNFRSTDYKAGIQNIYFAQNGDMTMFVANNLGILAFNGNSWEIHASNTGKKQRSLVFDESKKRLYVGSQGEFGYFEKDWNYVSLLEKTPKESQDFDEVWDVFIIGESVYFCTIDGIYIYDGEAVSVVTRDGGFNRSFYSNNRLYTQTPDGQLFELVESGLSPTLLQGQENDIVAGVISDDRGHYIFYNSGEVEYSTSVDVKSVFPELVLALAEKYVNDVIQLSDTRLVISTQRAGLFLYDMETQEIENIDKKDGLQSNACLRSFQDYAGNLWIGMQNGIALVDVNSPLRILNEDINIQGSGYDVFDTDEGRYYTTSNGIYFLAPNDTKSKFLTGTEGPAYGMQMINNRLYAGHHTGLFLLENGKARKCADTDGLWKVEQLKSNPEYAVGGTYLGLHLFKLNENNELQGIQKIKGFDESSRFFEEDNKGKIWVGQFYKGLYRLSLTESFKEAEVTKVSDSSNLPIDKHIILSRIDNELYLGTEEGVYKIDQTTDQIVEAVIFTNTIGKKWVYLLEQDNQKNVHIFTEDHLGFFKQVSANNYAYIPSSLFQLRQSFNNDLLNISINVEEGVLYNANEGFIHYKPNIEDRAMVEMKPIINQVYNVAEDSVLYIRLPFEARLDKIDPIVITQGVKILQFVVESFKYKDVNNSQYRYYLKGFDEDYGEWSGATLKEYTNLIVGNYELYVQTLNHLGEVVTSEPAYIEVHPPFFKSFTAKIIYAALLLYVLYLGYRFQKRYYKAKEKELKKDKQKELAQKQNELQKLKEVQTESELRHVNNLLAASTMNLVVKNEFMESIKEEIKQIKTTEEAEETQKALKRIVREIDTTLKVQEDWKQFEHHFDRVHGDFLSRLTYEFLDLTPGEQKLCAFLRLKMDTKEIANLMSISLRGVEVARYRLRKKLDLGTNQNLSKFILEY